MAAITEPCVEGHMGNYLDIGMNVVVSSPAGSGKTEKLARRYIALLKAGVDVERILAITFTDKAAAEMKQRILRILKDEDEELFKKILEKMSLMRVSTIHSFCGNLLRRFSFEASIAPDYEIDDAINSEISWEEIIYDVLMEASISPEMEEHKILFQTIGEKGFRGLEELKATMNLLYGKSPFSVEAEIPLPEAVNDLNNLLRELKEWPGAKEAINDYEKVFYENNALRAIEKYFLTDGKTPRKRPPLHLKGILNFETWALKMNQYRIAVGINSSLRRAERLKKVFTECYRRYRDKKAFRKTLDFSDLEYLTYKLITGNPEWANILYAFDEKTDHILVDEFQDTNTFQWAIIDKLTEEWRSGLGPKREKGIKPTVFLVGDEKQSIYFFRGANVELFTKAKDRFREWLKDEFYYEEVRDNFRSLPAIVDFTNCLFSQIMKVNDPEASGPWITRYSPFEAYRKEPDGCVELILIDEEAKRISDSKEREGAIMARRIQSIVGDFHIFDRQTNQSRQCRFGDIAVLLRKRTHLKAYEEALRAVGIPFVMVKGIGFYQEPEIVILRALIYFLSNPKDDYSLYVLLKSPLFNVKEDVILEAINEKENGGLFKNLKDSGEINDIIGLLDNWLLKASEEKLAELIEKALVQTKGWSYFWEPQRRANVKKFIRLVEEIEARGNALIEIRDFFERTFKKEEEAKANVNTEGMDAVKIMTIHAAKGLQFPVVFVPGLDDNLTGRQKDCLIYEDGGRFFLKYELDHAIRREDSAFKLHSKKEEEEAKRLFYVAVTRAEDALFLVSHWSEKDNNTLSYLKEGIGLKKEGAKFSINTAIKGFKILSASDVNDLYEKASKPAVPEPKPAQLEFTELKLETGLRWKTVTEVIDIRRRHGKDWLVLGDVLHRLFEGVSKGIIKEHELRMRAEKLLLYRGVSDSLDRIIPIIENEILLLKEKGIWDRVILPKENSYAELPFVLQHGNNVYTGRIDRVIVEDGIYSLYDYKTFPVEEREIEYLLREYSFQLNLYRTAVSRLFKPQNVRAFIIFTHTGDIKEI